MELVKLAVDAGKELKAVKLTDKYYGIVEIEGELWITSEGFTTPLQAANQIRRLKKSTDVKTPVKKAREVKPKPPKVKAKEPPKLYTEAEMTPLSQSTRLRFREVWVILNRKGLYVQRALTKTRVVQYCKDRDKAKSFKTYEEAAMLIKTLDSVCDVGHTLKRFFQENNEVLHTNDHFR